MRIMISVRAAAAAMIAVGFAVCASAAWAQTYPSRPIRLIVNFPPGGAGDILGRIIGNQLSIELHQSVVVENRSGAGGTIGARDVANAPPDGYTLTVGQTPEIAINPYFMKNVGYDPLKDLQPIALAGVMPLALVVPPKSPYATAAQWVAALRANTPLTFASAGVGTPGHLGGELLKLKLDDKLVHVPYKGAGPALNDVAGGQVDFYFPAYPGAVPLVQSGRVRMLAVSSIKRATLNPEIPTVAEVDRDRQFRFHAVGRLFRSARLAEGHRRAAQCADQQDHSRTRHQGAAAGDRRRYHAAVDRSVRHIRPRRYPEVPRDHQAGGLETRMILESVPDAVQRDSGAPHPGSFQTQRPQRSRSAAHHCVLRRARETPKPHPFAMRAMPQR